MYFQVARAKMEDKKDVIVDIQFTFIIVYSSVFETYRLSTLI